MIINSYFVSLPDYFDRKISRRSVDVACPANSRKFTSAGLLLYGPSVVKLV